MSGRLDFVTPLAQEGCIAALQEGAQQFTDQALTVRADGDRVWIASVWGVDRVGRPAVLWLFRFEGALTEFEIGTHVYGKIARNPVLEGGLALAGIIVVLIAVGGIALVDPVVGVLASPLVVLLGGFYVVYQRLLRRQSRELLVWIERLLLEPQGRAGGSLP